MNRNSSRQATTLSLVTRGFAVVKICFEWLKSKIPQPRLNLSLLFISEVHGMKAHYMSYSLLVTRI